MGHLSKWVTHLPLLFILSCQGRNELETSSFLSKQIRFPSFNIPIQVTSGSEANFSADPSVDGKQVFFVSEVSGNRDIWVKPLKGGFAQQVTFHSSDDFDPVLSPLGDKLAFVSRRSDAGGDIHIMRLGRALKGIESEGKVDLVARLPTIDRDPVWIENGESLLFSAREIGNKESIIKKVNLSTGEVERFLGLKGHQLSVSRDQRYLAYVRKSALYVFDLKENKEARITESKIERAGQPQFSSSNNDLVFIRYINDTNRDGKINGDDYPSIWRCPESQFDNIHGTILEPLTSFEYASYQPALKQNRLLFTLQDKKNLDVFYLPADGHLSRETVMGFKGSEIGSLESVPRRSFYFRKKAFYLLEKGNVDLALESLLAELSLYLDGGRRIDAKILFDKIEKLIPPGSLFKQLVALKMLRLKILTLNNSVSDTDSFKKTISKIRRDIEDIQRITAAHPQPEPYKKRVNSESLYLLGLQNEKVGNFFKAIEIYRELELAAYASERLRAQGALRQAILTEKLVGPKQSIKMHVGVIERYPNQRDTILKSADMALALAASQGDAIESLVGFKDQYQKVELLRAKAQLAIAKEYLDQGKRSVAENEYLIVIKDYPLIPEVLVEAAKEVGKIYAPQNFPQLSNLMSIAHQKLGAQEHSEAIKNLRRFEEAYFAVLLGEGERLLRQNEAGLAIDVYREVVKYQSDHILANRGLIDAFHLRKKTLGQIKKYSELALKEKNNFRLQYLYGYAYTYKIDLAKSPSEKLARIDESIEILLKTREMDGGVLHVHQTLGWLYGQKYLWNKRRDKEPGILNLVRKRKRLALDYLGWSEPNWALSSVDSYLAAYYLSQNGSVDQANLALNLGQSYYQLENFAKSLEFFLTRLSLNIPLRSKELEALIYRRSGRAAFQIERLDLAAHLQKKALEKWEALGRDQEIAYSLDTLALTLRESDRCPEAIKFLHRLQEVHERNGHKENLANDLINVAYCYYKIKEDQLSLSSFNAALQLLRQSKKNQKQTQENEKIRIDITGQASSVSGFSSSRKRVLIHTMRAKIFERMNRIDLAIKELEEKLNILRAEAKNENSMFLEKEIYITENNKGVLQYSVGDYRFSSDAFSKAVEGVKTRSKSGESIELWVNILNFCRSIQREISASNETREEIVGRHGTTFNSIEKFLAQNSMGISAKRAAEVRYLLGVIKGKNIREVLDSTESGAVEELVDFDRINSLALNLHPLALDPMPMKLKEKHTTKLLERMNSGFQDRKLTWKMYLNLGQYQTALDSLQKYIFNGDYLQSPMDRNSFQDLKQRLLVENLSSEPDKLFALVRLFENLTILELSNRMGVGDRPRILAFKKITAIKEIKDSLSANEAVISVEAVPGKVLFFLLTSSGLTLKIIDVHNVQPGPGLKSKDMLIIDKLIPDGVASLYVSPGLDFYGSPWEALQENHVDRNQPRQLSFLGNVDSIVGLKASSRIAKASMVNIVSDGTTNPELAGVNLSREYKELGYSQDINEAIVKYNIVHFSDPIVVSGAEKKYPMVGGGSYQLKGTGSGYSLKNLANLDLKKTSFLSFNGIQVKSVGRNQDVWLNLFLTMMAANVPSAVVPRMPTAKIDWQSFYTSLRGRSLAKVAMISGINIRVLGFHGVDGQSEMELAEQLAEEALDLAEASEDREEYLNASNWYKEVFYYYDLTGDVEMKMEVLDRLINNLFRTKEMDSALYFQIKKTNLYKGLDEIEYHENLLTAAIISLRKDEFDLALEYLEVCQKFFLEEEDLELLAKVYYYQGLTFEGKRLYKETIAKFKESRKLLLEEELEAPATRRLLDIGNIYNLRLSHYEKALEYYQLAVSEYQVQGNTKEILRVNRDLANTFLALGRTSQAIETLSDSLKLVPDKESEVRVGLNQIMTNALYRSGQYYEAITLNTEITAEIESLKSENKARFKIDALNLRGLVNSKLGKNEEAEKSFLLALKLALEHKLPGKESLVYNNLGFFLREVGEVDRSIDYLTRALAIDRRLKSQKNVAFDLRNLAFSVMLKGDLGRSEALMTESLELSQEIMHAYNTAYCLFGLGDLAVRKQDFKAALGFYKQAQTISKESFFKDFEWKALSAEANVLESMGLLGVAKDRLAKAVQIIEGLRSGLKSESSRSGFQADKGVQEVFEDFVRVLMEAGEIERAWRISERSRARAFMDSLGNQKIRFNNSEAMTLLRQERSLRNQIEEEEKKVAFGAVETKQGLEKLKTLEKERTALLKMISKINPQLNQFLTVDSISREKLQALLPEGTALLEYMVSKTAVFVWVIFEGKIFGETVPVEKNRINKLVEDFRSLTQNYSATDILGKSLSSYLLEPISRYIQNAQQLAIVPHSSLHKLSFAALPFGQSFLLDQFPLFYLESATLAMFTHGNETLQSKSNLRNEEKILAFGNPDIGKEYDLPFAEKEIKSFSPYFSRVTGILNSQATETKLKSMIKDHGILHIASHGEFDHLVPASSGLKMAKSDDDDGDLTVKEIFSLNLKARLVVMSACETGLGKLSRGDEIVGLNRAFFYAGAKSIVSTLWRISDVASAVIMKRFYRYLAEGHNLSDSLRMAQLVVREYYPHPAYWAAFRLLGNQR